MAEYEYDVTVWNEICKVTVYQKSKSVWIASGDYHGAHVEAERASRSAAVAAWREAARYKGN